MPGPDGRVQETAAVADHGQGQPVMPAAADRVLEAQTQGIALTVHQQLLAGAPLRIESVHDAERSGKNTPLAGARIAGQLPVKPSQQWIFVADRAELLRANRRST